MRLQAKWLEAGRDVEFVKVGDIVSVPFTSPVDAAVTAKKVRPASACTSTRRGPARLTDMSIWAAGSAGRPST